MPVITIIQAFGISLVVRAATGGRSDNNGDEKRSIVILKAVVRAPIVAAIFLSAGYIAKSVM